MKVEMEEEEKSRCVLNVCVDLDIVLAVYGYGATVVQLAVVYES